jgi:hypothetical protein
LQQEPFAIDLPTRMSHRLDQPWDHRNAGEMRCGSLGVGHLIERRGGPGGVISGQSRTPVIDDIRQRPTPVNIDVSQYWLDWRTADSADDRVPW